jgi:hypothetical protein
MKRTMTALAAVVLLSGSLAHAAALNVTIWQPIPGKAAAMMESAMAAKAIQEKLGASVTIALENTGRLHYVVGGFENWGAWAKWVAKLEDSEEWAAWQQQAGADPSAIQEENFILDTVPGTSIPVGRDDLGSVYQVFIWDPPGTNVGPLVDRALEAAAIHAKAGIPAGVSVDQYLRMHYVMNYEDWAHWAKVRDNPIAEFEQFMLRNAATPVGDLVEVYTANRLP